MHRHLFNNNQKVAPQGLSVVNPQHRANGVGNFPAPARIGNGGFARLARPISGGLPAVAGDGRALRGGHANRGQAAAQADTPVLLAGGSFQESHGDGQRNGDMRLPCGSGTDLSSFKYNIQPYRDAGNFGDGTITKRYPINELRHINNTSRGAVMLPNCPPAHPPTLPMQQQTCGFSPAFSFSGGQPMLEDSLDRQQNADEANGRRNIYLPPMLRQQGPALGPQMGPKLPQMHPSPMPGGNPPILPNGNLARPPMLPPQCNNPLPLPMNGAALGRPPIGCNGSAMGAPQNMAVMVNPVKPQQQSPQRNGKTPGKRVLSMGVEWAKFWQMSSQPLKELSDLALGGSEICAQMAHSHRSRPCFRKIDSLCARLKQDLMRPPSILSNINSQGMAWAVKDFIFVFTRISSAWVIIKGYLYDSSDGMAKVQATLSPKFPSSFAQWQTSTFHFLGEMIDSVHRLDRLERQQKTPAAALLHADVEEVQEAAAMVPPEAADSGHSSNGSESSRGSTPRKVDYSVITIKDSDAVQMNAIRNDTYLRAGTYSSIDQKALKVTFPKGIPLSPKDVLLDLTVPPPGYLANGLKAPPPEGQQQHQPDAKVADDDVTGRLIDTKVAYIKFGLLNLVKLFGCKSFEGMLQQVEQNDGIDVEALKLAATVVGHFASGELGGQFRAMLRQCVQESLKTAAKEEPEEAIINGAEKQEAPGQETDDLHAALIERDQALAAQKINALVMHVVGMKNAEIFFEKSIIHCHFPGFDTLFGPYFSDIHTITQKKNAGDYHNIPLVLHDIRKILYYGRHYLKINEDAILREAIDNYEKDFNEIFKEPPFNGYSYPEIEGKPSEMFLLDRLENRRF